MTITKEGKEQMHELKPKQGTSKKLNFKVKQKITWRNMKTTTKHNERHRGTQKAGTRTQQNPE